eukprot:CAMPEP_0175994744 /NCGR_PEP_ID=MMETSP0108-20121206/54757_1 /TAXON_ID=195067 ORGANISM="Goniomonas pacifica, Strain CCMP1869" /NCGR_SAMPLE_ID=MMETSP0108 /ASSEMBLY_ACC=CAM_ASM_000204 /LENGTH=452 /DNA_ID=CAMNT_0017326811 /DNA_START=1 /DNA_END=1359 /DNA_ORIENTATION=+
MMRFLALLALVTGLALSRAAYVPVYVMLPLDTITVEGFSNPSTLKGWLDTLKVAGTDGVTVDVWWGIVEAEPKAYNWTAYSQLLDMIRDAGLKAQPILSFHKCGGNVGDKCNVPLPSWVLSVASENSDVLYKDQDGNLDDEYISLWADNLQLFQGRTAVQLYSDFAASFSSTFAKMLGNTIVEVEIGMGPAGELRYPSYQLEHWNFCGVGEFQSYSGLALDDVNASAVAAGHPEWGMAGGPNNAGNYSSYISGAPFFQDGANDNYASDYGKFFLQWYSSRLLQHGDDVLKAMAVVFKGSGVRLMGKVAGIHWWYKASSHAAELTAGYYNTNQNDAYADLASLFHKYGAAFDFTCMEMLDASQPSDCDCGPQELVAQTKQAAINANVPYGGENALPFLDAGGYKQVEAAASELGKPIDAFSFLRLTQQLVSQPALGAFTDFVNDMHNLADQLE